MRLLHAIHDYLPAHRSGSEIYAHALGRALRARGHELDVVCAEWDASAATGTVRTRIVDSIRVHEVVNNWDVETFEEGHSPTALAAPLRALVRELRPEVVHVHNLLNLSFDLPAIARGEGAAVVATLHDFTLFCASGGQRVHVAERHVCHEIDSARCARCFRTTPFYRAIAAGVGRHGFMGLMAGLRRRWTGEQAAPSVTASDLEARTRSALRAIAKIDWFVAPSRALGVDATRFGVPAERLEHSDYGFEALREIPRPHYRGPVRIGFVGTLIWHKGAHVLVEALGLLSPGSFVARLHGPLDWFPDYVDELRALSGEMPIEFRGPFGPGEAADILAGTDLLVVPSLWPENSPLVIHEAFQARVPVVGARIGGIPELVVDGVNGATYDPTSPTELAARLRLLIEDPELRDRLSAAAPEVKSIETDAAEWEARYQRARAGATRT